MEATIIGKVYGIFSGDRYFVEYKDGTEGSPCEGLIYTSREEYYNERINECKDTIKECRKRLKEGSLISTLP